MNYTNNYHLPQWVESDRILMEDFNQAMETLDGGIAAAKAAADTAESKADAAQATADTAESKADAAQATADNAYCPNYMPFATGSYTGNLTPTKFTLGFRPSMVIIGRHYSGNDETETVGTCHVFQGNGVTNVLTLDNDGFTVIGDVYNYPNINWGGRNYVYIAFR